MLDSNYYIFYLYVIKFFIKIKKFETLIIIYMILFNLN